MPVFTGVGIVAVRTASLCDHLVDTRVSGRQKVIVALEADPLGLQIKEISMVGSMGIVTLRALSFGNGSMDIAELHLLLKRLMAGKAKVSFRSGFEFGDVLSLYTQRQEQDPDEPQDC